MPDQVAEDLGNVQDLVDKLLGHIEEARQSAAALLQPLDTGEDEILPPLADPEALRRLEWLRCQLTMIDVALQAGGWLSASPKPPETDPAYAWAEEEGGISTAEAAANLGVDASHVRRLLLTGALTGHKEGRDWLVSPGSLAAYQVDAAKGGRPRGKKALGNQGKESS